MKLKKGLYRLSAIDLAAKAKFIEERMAGNASFPAPIPSLETISIAREALENSIAPAMDGGRMALTIRNARHKTLKDLLDQLAGHVVSVAGEDEELIESGGFEVRRRAAPLPEPVAPLDLRASLSAHSGRADLTWAPVRGAAAYHVQVNRLSPDEATAWELLGPITRSRYTVTGLESAKVHWFRVAAIAAAGKGPWSDVAHTLVR